MRVVSIALLAFACAHVMPAQDAAAKDVITKVKRLTSELPGKVHDYSAWQLLESDPAPEGYLVAEAQLTLSGGASCGSTAQCIEGERTAKQSTWLFRYQAHGTPVEAVLTTKYRKIGSEVSYILIKKTPERFSSRGLFLGCFTATSEQGAPAKSGAWCTIAADPPKDGYRIKSSSFSLAGDRSCAGNDFDPEEGDETAECRLVKRSDRERLWEFRMLGHMDEGRELVGRSFGELRTVYEKLP